MIEGGKEVGGRSGQERKGESGRGKAEKKERMK